MMDLSDKQKLVLAHVFLHPGINTNMLARKTHIYHTATIRILRRLAALGLVREVVEMYKTGNDGPVKRRTWFACEEVEIG